MSNQIVAICVMSALCFWGTACKKKADSSKTTDRGSTTSVDPVAPDNTGKNKVDREANTKTPFDQSESAADIKITAEIRRAIMNNTSMSTDAQNCKIMTSNGIVTLRGPVQFLAEKEMIGTLAEKVAGVIRVDNQLEVKTP